MNKPNYPYKPISDINTLSRALGVNINDLQSVKTRSNELFFKTSCTLKNDGSTRLIYDAEPELKNIHDKICSKLLKRVDYPNYLQGSLKNKDYLTDAQKHTKSNIIINEDITNFFPSISKKVVYEMWIGVFKFSHPVAECLAELTTLNDFLVQGAKTSSYIANLILWNRESKLVTYFESKGLIYTRYVDDITISSKRSIARKEKSEIINSIYNMFRSIDAKPHRKKHKIMSKNNQQNIHGVNINRKQPSMPKKKRANIRAAVYSCELEYKNSPNSSKYLKLFNSTMGKVNTMMRMHKEAANKLKSRLLKIKPQN